MEKGGRSRSHRAARAQHVWQPDGLEKIRDASERLAHRSHPVVGERGVGQLGDQERRLQRDVLPQSTFDAILDSAVKKWIPRAVRRLTGAATGSSSRMRRRYGSTSLETRRLCPADPPRRHQADAWWRIWGTDCRKKPTKKKWARLKPVEPISMLTVLLLFRRRSRNQPQPHRRRLGGTLTQPSCLLQPAELLQAVPPGPAADRTPAPASLNTFVSSSCAARISSCRRPRSACGPFQPRRRSSPLYPA